MTTIFLLLLFIMQIVVFYFMVLLYMKVAKFDELEKKQKKLMREMDDSVSVYLAELKDENDRLIEQLAVYKEETRDGPPEQRVEKATSPQQQTAFITPKIPVNLALQSYNATSLQSATKPEGEMDERTRAFQLHDSGYTIEEIAKKLGKGKTEIELLLKFR